MGASIARSAAQHQDNDGVLPLVGAARHAQPTDNGEVFPLWFVECCDRALARVMAHKEASITLKTDKANLSRQRHGEKPWDIRRFGLLDRDFADALIDELRVHFKIDDDADRLRRAIEGRAACDRVIDELARKAIR